MGQLITSAIGCIGLRVVWIILSRLALGHVLNEVGKEVNYQIHLIRLVCNLFL